MLIFRDISTVGIWMACPDLLSIWLTQWPLCFISWQYGCYYMLNYVMIISVLIWFVSHFWQLILSRNSFTEMYKFRVWINFFLSNKHTRAKGGKERLYVIMKQVFRLKGKPLFILVTPDYFSYKIFFLRIACILCLKYHHCTNQLHILQTPKDLTM